MGRRFRVCAGRRDVPAAIQPTGEQARILSPTSTPTCLFLPLHDYEQQLHLVFFLFNHLDAGYGQLSPSSLPVTVT